MPDQDPIERADSILGTLIAVFGSIVMGYGGVLGVTISLIWFDILSMDVLAQLLLQEQIAIETPPLLLGISVAGIGFLIQKLGSLF